ncbi:MAG: hypothetical protein K0S51_1195 [Bacillales bacterium]|jgi:SepF-like predicted cell division protein (DUF552 family)|nr:hypothetical protein [Bacillales bacterium]
MKYLVLFTLCLFLLGCADDKLTQEKDTLNINSEIKNGNIIIKGDKIYNVKVLTEFYENVNSEKASFVKILEIYDNKTITIFIKITSDGIILVDKIKESTNETRYNSESFDRLIKKEKDNMIIFIGKKNRLKDQIIFDFKKI